MDKYIYNEKNGLWYELQGDYYLPCLKLPEEPEVHIGIWTTASPIPQRPSQSAVYLSAYQRQVEQFPC